MKRFIRLKQGRKIFGICEGLGLLTLTDPILWRLLFIALIFSPFPIITFYIILALFTDEYWCGKSVDKLICLYQKKFLYLQDYEFCGEK